MSTARKGGIPVVKHILFVCTGNTCRSPMAEYLGRKLAEASGLSFTFSSAGACALDGQAMAENAKKILRETGTSGEGFASHPLTPERVRQADLILTMTASHKRIVIQQFPEAVDKTYILKEYIEDNAEVASLIEECNRLEADLLLRQTIGERITERDRQRLNDLQSRLPNYDIADPFGHDLAAYRRCAEELKAGLEKLLAKFE
jgi:protein-tyrosine phosphatase